MPRRLGSVLVISVISLVTSLTSCSSDLVPSATYKPVWLPIKFSVAPGRINILGDRAIVTPIGIFSVGASYSLPYINPGSIYVIVRNRREHGVGYDHIYRVQSGAGEFTAVVNGTTLIQVRNNQVLIDVTGGSVQSIRFKRLRHPIAESGPVPQWVHKYAKRWSHYYRASFYKPFSLFSWAYGDSTIFKWYGIGFIWFLIRLAVALFLLIIDFILTGVFLFAGAAYVLIGGGAQGFAYAVSALIFIWVIRHR